MLVLDYATATDTPPVSPESGASGAFRTTLTGIEISGNPTFEQFQAEFEATWYSEMATNWSRGDLLVYGEAKFGEAYAQVVDPRRFNPKTLANNMWVCRAFKPEERVPNVSFSDHAECAALEGEQRAFAMGKLASGEWQRKDVRKWKRELNNEPEKPRKQAITITPELVQTADGRMRYALPENLPLWIFEKPLTIYVETRAA